VLKEAISELSDLPGAGSVRVSVAPHEPHFHLAAGGVYGALEIFLPKSSEVCFFGGLEGRRKGGSRDCCFLSLLDFTSLILPLSCQHLTHPPSLPPSLPTSLGLCPFRLLGSPRVELWLGGT